jgi:hypothetical protein
MNPSPPSQPPAEPDSTASTSRQGVKRRIELENIDGEGSPIPAKKVAKTKLNEIILSLFTYNLVLFNNLDKQKAKCKVCSKEIMLDPSQSSFASNLQRHINGKLS